jgi:hypothetical protein
MRAIAQGDRDAFAIAAAVEGASVTGVAYRDLDANWLSRGTEQDAKSQVVLPRPG